MQNIETLKHWSIQALEIPFYCTDGIKIIFMLTRNNSKQLSCILLIIHTGAINFQIHNEFHEQKVATSMKYISQHIPQPLTEVWLWTSSISHLPLLLCLFRYWCWCKVPNSRKQITCFFWKHEACKSYFVATQIICSRLIFGAKRITNLPNKL